MTTSTALTLASAVHCVEGAEVMLYRILSVSAIVLCLILAYFLWRSYKYNKVLAKKCEQLQLQNGNSSSPLSTEEVTTPLPHQGGAGGESGGGSTPLSLGEGAGVRLLFHRLCQLMDGPDQIFTDPELNRCRLAQLLGTNEHYVSDAVSACTNGGSITDFLNGYRLRHAVQLLATTNDSIGLIAELSGFSRRSFYRVFDEEYHTSPSEYRKAMRKA